MNRGAQALTKKTSEWGAQTRLARKTGLSQSYLSRLSNAEVVPGIQTRIVLRDEIGIGLDWWEQPAKSERAA